MTYIIAEPCIDVKDKSCIDVCPVDCIHEMARMLVIDPEECIDCGACEPECPVEAIFPEDALPDKWEPFIKINYAYPDNGAIDSLVDTYATELCREAEISGRVVSETRRRAAVLTEQTGLSPRISWSKTGSIQLNGEITVTLTLDMNIGLFGGFGSFPITLRSEASGKSEVYHK